jgi:hypothetical protein
MVSTVFCATRPRCPSEPILPALRGVRLSGVSLILSLDHFDSKCWTKVALDCRMARDP